MFRFISLISRAIYSCRVTAMNRNEFKFSKSAPLWLVGLAACLMRRRCLIQTPLRGLYSIMISPINTHSEEILPNIFPEQNKSKRSRLLLSLYLNSINFYFELNLSSHSSTILILSAKTSIRMC